MSTRGSISPCVRRVGHVPPVLDWPEENLRIESSGLSTLGYCGRVGGREGHNEAWNTPGVRLQSGTQLWNMLSVRVAGVLDGRGVAEGQVGSGRLGRSDVG